MRGGASKNADGPLPHFLPVPTPGFACSGHPDEQRLNSSADDHSAGPQPDRRRAEKAGAWMCDMMRKPGERLRRTCPANGVRQAKRGEAGETLRRGDDAGGEPRAQSGPGHPPAKCGSARASTTMLRRPRNRGTCGGRVGRFGGWMDSRAGERGGAAPARPNGAGRRRTMRDETRAAAAPYVAAVRVVDIANVRRCRKLPQHPGSSRSTYPLPILIHR